MLGRDLEQKLRAILVHAFETVPYYRAAWSAAGVDPREVRQATDMQRFPFLSKDVLRTARQSLLSDEFRESDLDLSFTGGTTGTSTGFYRDHDCTVLRIGRHWGVLEYCGYRPGMRRALVWGANSDLPAAGNKSVRRCIRDFAAAQRVLDCKVMTERDMAHYHRTLVRFRPDVLYGYPSALEQFGRFVADQHLEPIRVRVIFATAERTTAKTRAVLESLFSGVVFNLYCTREYGCVGFECREHQGFHVDTDSVYVEITRDGQPVAPGESGEITITDLLNRGMPLIRSRTGDVGVLSDEPCACGLSFPRLQSLDGRVTDALYRPDGSIVTGLMLPDLFQDMDAIEAAQFIQVGPDELEVLLVVNDHYSNAVEREARRQVRQIMGTDMKVHLRLVPEIPRNGNSGKYQEVICRAVRPEATKERDPCPLAYADVSRTEKMASER